MSSRGSIALLPRTRRGLVLFWTALFMLSIGLQYAAATMPKAVFAAQECESYAIFTSDPEGVTNNKNIYESKADVFLNGGPASAGGNLTTGSVFYYQVQEPDGTPLMEIRSTTVLGTGPHAGRFFVGLAPFDDTSNSGGEYKVVVSTDPELKNGSCTKSDNFKVIPAPGNLKIEKVVEGGPEDFSGDFTFHVDCGDGNEYDVTVASGSSETIEDIPAGSECTIEETGGPDAPAGFEWVDVDIDPNPITIESDETVTVTVTNTLEELPPTPALTIEKSNDAPGVGETPLEDGDTVNFKLDYTLSNGPVDAGVITDVLPDGLTYVNGSATDSANGEFVFDGYDAGTRTLTWLATSVTESGSVTYAATVDEGAAELPQPLTNTACISSEQTEEVCVESDVFVGAPPAGETSVPTGPQTDAVGTSGTAEPNGSLLLVLLALAAIAVTVAFVAPSPAAIRKRK